MGPIFTVDWEPWFCFKHHGIFWYRNDPLVEEPTFYLLDLLRRHQIKAIFYIVGWLKDKREDLFDKIKGEGHIIGDHTYYHEPYLNLETDNLLYRPPRWHGVKRLFSGGFWFRALPYRFIKDEVLKTGFFFIHPHDLLFDHPDCGNFIKTFERRIGLKTVRDKLERLCREVGFECPLANQPAKN